MAAQLLETSLRMPLPMAGKRMQIGDYFFAHSVQKANAGGLMNPLRMVGHFRMKRESFGFHPHAGILAAT